MLDVIHGFGATPHLLQAIGVFGFVLYVGSFLAVQNGSICGNGTLYPLIQVVAAFCVLMSLVSSFNLASFLIQISYVCIGFYGIALRWRAVQSRSNEDNSKIKIDSTALKGAV